MERYILQYASMNFEGVLSITRVPKIFPNGSKIAEIRAKKMEG